MKKFKCDLMPLHCLCSYSTVQQPALSAETDRDCASSEASTSFVDHMPQQPALSAETHRDCASSEASTSFVDHMPQQPAPSTEVIQQVSLDCSRLTTFLD